MVARHAVLAGRAQLSVLPEHGPGAVTRNARQRISAVSPASMRRSELVEREVEVRDLALYDQMLEAVREVA